MGRGRFLLSLARAEAFAGRMTVSAVCDIRRDRAEAAAREFGVPRVCVLCDGAADPFADPHGVHCLPRDAANGWHLQLARTLKRAGIEVDLNKLC